MNLAQKLKSVNFLVLFLCCSQHGLNAMQLEGDSLIETGKDVHSGRARKIIINGKMFNRLDRPFEKMNSLIQVVLQQQDDFESFILATKEQRKPDGIKPIFSITEGEAVFIRGNLSASPSTSYFTTGGVNNCIGVTLYGLNPGKQDFFTGLAHIARWNTVNSLGPLLKILLEYPNRRITLHSGYKSQNLLNIFQHIYDKGLEVEVVYVNKAYHDVNDDDVITVIHHPEYFGKTSIEEIDAQQPYVKLVESVYSKNQASTNIIVESKTGKLVGIPEDYINHLTYTEGTNFRRVSDSFRRSDLPEIEPILGSPIKIWGLK